MRVKAKQHGLPCARVAIALGDRTARGRDLRALEAHLRSRERERRRKEAPQRVPSVKLDKEWYYHARAKYECGQTELQRDENKQRHGRCEREQPDANIGDLAKGGNDWRQLKMCTCA